MSSLRLQFRRAICLNLITALLQHTHMPRPIQWSFSIGSVSEFTEFSEKKNLQ